MIADLRHVHLDGIGQASAVDDYGGISTNIFLQPLYMGIEEGAPDSLVPQPIKLNNVPDAITDLTLERLTDVSHKYMDTAIALFDGVGILESGIVSGGTKIKVLFPHNVGEIWFGTEDYNKTGITTDILSRFKNGHICLCDADASKLESYLDKVVISTSIYGEVQKMLIYGVWVVYNESINKRRIS